MPGEIQLPASRIAVVTGVAGGIGSAIAHRLGRAGYQVIGIDLRPPEDGVVSDFLPIDLDALGADEAVGRALVVQIKGLAAGQPIQLLVNNAALQIVAEVEKLTLEDWRRTFNVNLFAPFQLSRLLAADLRATSGGVIVNIGSVHASATKRNFAVYATSKAALHAMGRSLALDLAPGIRVLTVAPAAVDTPMLKAGFPDWATASETLAAHHPMQRIARPEEIAEAVVWLASPAVSFMTGVTLTIDGGVLTQLHDPF